MIDKFIEKIKPHNILDIGCGDGSFVLLQMELDKRA